VQLARSKGQERPAAIEKNPAFQAALSCISPSAMFWGIRLFGQGDDTKDPTSLHNARGLLGGFHDPQAVFAALQLSKVESLDVQFHYASGDPVAATKRFPEELGGGIKLTQMDNRSAVLSNDRHSKDVIASMTLDLTKVIVAGMDEPSVLFLAVCTVFGQGILL
jgi:hypothetical protein